MFLTLKGDRLCRCTRQKSKTFVRKLVSKENIFDTVIAKKSDHANNINAYFFIDSKENRTDIQN